LEKTEIVVFLTPHIISGDRNAVDDAPKPKDIAARTVDELKPKDVRGYEGVNEQDIGAWRQECQMTESLRGRAK
jgi:hypothetical protein